MYLETGQEFAVGLDAGDSLMICVTDAIGLGVRTMIGASSGAVLDRFTGEIGPEIKQHSLQVSPGQHITETRFIGYLTHSCAPNCRLDMERFELVAQDEIAAGDLLTIDYAATEDRLHVQFACHCGADRCRHWITGREDPVSADGLNYLAARGEIKQRA